MEQNKIKGYGGRGWLLIIWIATAFLAYIAIGNYPLNILSDFYGGQQTLSAIYTVASVIGVILQLVASGYIGKMKSVKNFGVIMGVLSILALLGIMFIPGAGFPGAPAPAMQKVWQIVYALGTVLSVMYGTFALSILVGQWFPTRKGSVMGIATFAFPIGNGVISAFAGTAMGGLAIDGTLHVAQAFAPFLIIFIVGLVIGAIFIPDYPEEVGAYRDNNPNMTPEMAKAMMEEEIENKKTTVWKLNHTFTTRDFWFITIPAGLLLMFSVGTMTQTQSIITVAGLSEQFGMIMGMIMIFGLLGSFILGLLDQKLGTQKAMIIACVIMILAGAFGVFSSLERNVLVIAALICLAMFMGASSNFTVSLAAQYWRREDFSTVFAAVNPIANGICALGPVVIGMIVGPKTAPELADILTAEEKFAAVTQVFGVIGVMGIVAVILMVLFSAAHVKEKDDEYRKAAGKKLDDALTGRK